MRLRFFTCLFPLAGLFACGERPESYDAPLTDVASFGLEDRVAVIDKGADRVVLLTPQADQRLDRSSVYVGKGTLRVESSIDRKRLFVLTTGDLPRRKELDERPALTVIEGGAGRRYELESPHSGFAVDPEGRYVALFAAPPGPSRANVPSAFVENPNEIVIVDLTAPQEAAITPRTLRSFGGRPQRVSFTKPLLLPGGVRRLLVVETDQDLQLLDLDNVRATPRRPEITVRLTSGSSAAALRPAAIVIDDGDPAKADDARIGVRVEGSPSVFTLTLVGGQAGAQGEEPGTVPNDFRPEINLTDVGAPPSDIVFVRTDAGLRLAAIVPATKSAVLVDPTTSITTNVELAQSYSKLSLITNVVGGAAGSDTALLYGTTGGIAFWSLGRAASQTYRTVEVVPLAGLVDRVLDVPPPRPELKVLQGNAANTFFVLNLASRTAAPLITQGSANLHVSPDGQRVWAFKRGSPDLSQVTLDNLHPRELPLDRPVDALFDVARPDGGRALIAIDVRGGVGATVLDALAPDTTTSRSYYGLLLEGL